MTKLIYVGSLPGRRTAGGVGSTAAHILSGLSAAGFRIRAISHVGSNRSNADRFAGTHPDVALVPYMIPDRSLAKGSHERILAHDRCIAASLRTLAAQSPPSAVLVSRPALAHGIVDLVDELNIPMVVNVPSLLRWVVDGEPRYPEDVTAALYDCLRRADAVVAVASHIADDLAEMGVEDVITIPNGIDVQQFSPAPPDRDLQQSLDIGDDDIVVLHVSNLKPVKRSLDLVQAAARALPHNHKLLTLVVGDGPLRSEMEALCRRLGIAARFRFVGWRDHDRIPAYLSLADMAVMPSTSEGLSIVYLETMAAGKVLLASDIAAAREVISDGETGVLFPHGDVEALTQVTLALAADPDRRRQIGRQARALVARRFDNGTMAAAYADLLGRVIRRSGRRA